MPVHNFRQEESMKTAIEGIPTGDIKPLKDSRGSYRLRVGGWRIIFHTRQRIRH